MLTLSRFPPLLSFPQAASITLLICFIVGNQCSRTGTYSVAPRGSALPISGQHSDLEIVESVENTLFLGLSLRNGSSEERNEACQFILMFDAHNTFMRLLKIRFRFHTPLLYLAKSDAMNETSSCVSLSCVNLQCIVQPYHLT